MLTRLALWWLGRKWIEQLCVWAGTVEVAAQKHGLNPAMREYFADHVIAGKPPDEAAALASGACEIVEFIAKK